MRYFASLTSRLVLTTVVLVLVVSVLVGTATTLAVRNYLTSQLDESVHASLIGMTRGFGGPPVGGPGQGVGSLQAVWTGDDPTDGQSRVSTQQSDGRRQADTLSPDALDQLAEVPTDGRIRTVELDGVGSYRIAADTVGEQTVAVGVGTGNVDDAVTNLIWWELLLALLAVLAAGGAATVVVRRQLRPLREVAATAHSVSELPLAEGEIDLTERVPEHLTDERTEVGQVGSALNTLLEHVETSLAARHRSEQQVRQFVADASHELRTPLATIAGYTELARQRPDDPGMLGTALDKVEEESAG